MNKERLRVAFERRYPVPSGIYYGEDHDEDEYIDDAMKGGAAGYNSMWAAYLACAEDFLNGMSNALLEIAEMKTPFCDNHISVSEMQRIARTALNDV